MKVKLSKKLLSAFLALMLVVTSAPLSAISALAADSNAISTKNGVTSYLTENVTDGVETNYNDAVTWDEDERAAYFDGTGYLELEGTPLSGASSADGFAISFDVKRSSSNGDNGRIIDVANSSGSDSFAINGGSDSTNSWRRYMTLALVGGVECSYYTSDFSNSTYCTTTGTNLTDETTADTWINITVTVDPDGYYSYYIDGELRATFTNEYDTAYASASNGLSSSTFGDSVAEASIYYIGRSIYDADPYFQGYIRNVKFCDSYATAVDIFANSANSDSSIDKLAGAIEQYATFMDSALADSVTFDGIADSYDKYVAACEAYDAYYYGGNTETDIDTATSELALATIPLMESRGYYDTPNYVPDTAFSGDTSYDNQYELYDTHYDSLLYATNSASTAYTGSKNSRLTARIVIPQYVVAFYDGETTPRFGAMPGYSSDSSSYTRGSSCFYVTDSSASVRPDSDWYYRSGTTYDFSWTLADPTGTIPYYLSTTTTSASVKANAYRYMAGNLAIYPEFGETDGYVQMGSVEFTCRNYDSELYATVTADFSGVYVLNYAGYKTALDGTFAALEGISVSDYKEGGLSDMMALLQSAADVDFDTDFSSDTATNAAAVGNEITEFLTAYAAGITMTTDDAYAYLRGENGFEHTGTIAAFVEAGDETVYSVIGAYNNGTRKGFSADSYEAFVEAYKAAQAVMSPVYADGYYTDHTADEIEAAADALIAAFNALEPVSVTAPSVTDSCLLGPSNGFVITTNDTDDSAVTYYTLAYSNGTTYEDIVATSGDTIYPFESVECVSVTVTAYTALGDDDSKTVTATYTYYYAPTVSVSDEQVISGTYPVTISSNNTEANAGTLQYSYDGTNWYDYTAKFAPFSADEIAKRTEAGLDNADTTCTIYAREVNGSAVSGTTTVSNLIRRATFGIYSDSQYGSEYIDSSATITIADISTYTGTITYVITIDGTTTVTGTYDRDNGIPVSSISQLADACVVEVKAYATSQGTLDQYAAATFYNHDNYTPLAYQESFTDASISSNSFTTGMENGLDGTVTSSDLFQVVDGAGILDSNGNSTSWRNNVLYVSSSDSNSALVLSENPLSSGTAQTVANKTGATITFWRYVEDSSGTNSSGYAIFDDDWLECLTFETETSTSANPNYFTVSASAQVSRDDDETNKLDIYPEEQGVTEHEVGNNSCYWVQVAVVIDPDEGVKVYTNGQEHEVADLDVKGSITANDGDAAQAILEFLTDSDTKLSLGAAQNNTITASYYLDDVRVYSTALTQTDINNMYNDDYADVDTSSSTAHDPTAVTVYTLTDGSQVGQTYFDQQYYLNGEYDYSEVVATDYYIFGTGMTVYHFNDTTEKWEVIGDSEGRCGYQDQDLFGDVYTTALSEPLAYAATDSSRAGAGKLVWAPHVIYNVNLGMWCYYGSTSSWGSQTSAIFLCTSSSPTGPYEYQCIVYSSTSHPNAIDPCVYYSADFSQLYMVYGSWGGESAIYCKRLYSNGTGMLDGSGSVICYGINSTLESGSSDGGSGEGAFVEYNYDTGYYYLYVSYGQNTGSYVERVYRSTEPNTGFVDATGVSATDNETYSTHGTQILSPFNSSSNDYIYVSTGHSSVYTVTTDNGEVIDVNSVHARPLASDDNGWVALEDGALATRQVDLSGNVSLQNAIGYTADGWPVLMAYTYNGTDSFTSDVTMYDLEGIYMSNDMQLTVTYSYSEEYRMTFLAVDETTAIMYGKTSTGVSFRNPVVLEKGDDGVNYLTIYTDDTYEEVFARGVLMTQVQDGETKYCYTIINEYEASDDYGMVSWCYRSGDLPETDLESNGDSVSTSGVIYTHLENGDYTMYGQEISDDYEYGTTGHTGERFTQITLNYPNYIDTSDDGSIYSLFDQERCLEEGSTYTGGLYLANDMHDGLWYDPDTGDTYTDAQAMAADSEIQARLVHEYYISGYVSNYFCYNEDTGEYTESGVEFAITYYDLETGNSYGEYEFLYVLPNPAWAHTIQGIRNTSDGGAGVDRRNSELLFSRFTDSVGSATTLMSEYVNALNIDTDSVTTNGYVYGTGTYNYLGNYETVETLIENDESSGTISPTSIGNTFTLYDSSVGVNAGSYGVVEMDEDNTTYSFTMTSNVVDVDYYVDYSDTESSLITYDEDGTPTGYSFNLLLSNLYWNCKNDDYLAAATSYVNDTTGLTTSYSINKSDETYLQSTADSTSYIDYNDASTAETYVLTGTDYSEDLSSGRAALTSAFDYLDNGYNEDDLSFEAQVTFSGKESLAKNTDTTSAETYANYILESGVSPLLDGWFGTWYSSYNLYSYYNIGVSTCDKGAVRYFANTYINKVIDIETDEDGNITGWTATDEDLNSGEYTVASYTAYLEAIAEAFWFYENTYNTTYTDDDGNTCEYTVAYDSDGTPIFDTETAGIDIFGENDGSTYTDPVQAQLIQNIVEAYNNLMSITEYEEAEETYSTALTLADVVGEYTADSVAAYNALLANVADYFGYDTDTSAQGTENYWRYVSLNTEEYNEVVAYIEAIKDNLMPVVTVDTALATAVTDADGEITAYTAEDGDGTALGTALTKQNTGIFDEDDETEQIYSYASWYAIYQEILKAEGYLEAAVDYTDHEANMYNYDETVTIEVLGETYEYSTYTESEDNYSDLQKDLIDEVENLNALELESVDEDSCYDTFDIVVTLYENMDRNKYTDEALELIDALVTQLTTGISSDIITNCEDDSISYFADTYVYAQDSSFVEAYNSIMSTSLDTDYQFRMTALYETDTITAVLLSLLSGNMDENDIYTFYKYYTSTFTVQVVDTNGDFKAVNVDENGDVEPIVRDTYYGDTFYFDAADVLNEYGYSADDYTVANWSATLYDGTSDDYDSTSGDFTSDTTASHKISSFENTDWAKIADSNVAVVVTLAKDDIDSDVKRIEVYNVYHVLSEIYYVDAADSPTEGTNTSKSLTVGDYTIIAADIPFYTFANWSIAIDDETGYYTLKPNYSATDVYKISVQDGGTISGDVTETEIENTYQAVYDANVTVDGSGITDFYAWAIDNGDGTYVVASYESNYSFYVVADEDFVAITYNDDDGYCIDDTEITADMIPYGLPENYDADADDIAGMTGDEFIAYKLENKLPFIAIEYVGFPSSTKVRCYVRVTTGASGTTGYGVVCDYTGSTSEEDELISGTTGVRTFTVDSLLDSGQFVVTLNKSSGFSTDVAFRAYVTYDFSYSYTGYVDGSSTTTTYSGSISAVEYSAKAVAEV